ncbi:Eco57I restriction-modification methylase domain-containing protein [Microbacterium sp. Root53]|uniref:Eco57I restriction-modification methylase domain-containing protein n=1 Tax=Microbacterium sp. Root53 TaxID=1736553 RepID=UPI00138F343E|nr:N-6 DNA methylase [Microbacterium sp. Root53]
MARAADVRELVAGLVDTPPFPDRLRALVDSFRESARSYRSADYKEMALRSEFLNPLLEELGWDPVNSLRSSFIDREVIQEASVTVDGRTKAPDYGFYTDGRPRFFMEAKRPSVNIETDRAPAYQLRRYCWTADLPYGLVTDFEEYAIYDCRRPPEPADSALVGRIAYFTIDELEDNWPLLHGMFGRTNVGDGVLELLAAEAPAPKGTRTIDSAFLDEIRGWRRTLATDIATRNPALTNLEVSSATQTLIDRIVFLRVAEARGLEVEGTLQRALEEPNVYGRLLTIFKRADDRYNSGLFHLNGGEDDPRRDAIGLSIEVADTVLRTIIGRLYFPEPYEFSVMPADILGRIYEQFLGERIVVGDDRSVRVELKPEYRKSSGVYYTPSPVVEFIVKETLGRLLEGKTPASLRKTGFAVVDPASGSGSFLIAAYRFLLDWHRDHWAAQTANSKKFLEVGLDGKPRVNSRERKRILLDYIFGVDIDPQAVEVTKLSLLLMVIEGQAQLEFEIGRILPDLDRNILCGNSLVDHDFPVPLGASAEEVLAYNPFSWRDSFPAVFKRGGFDAVIGNPPYLNVDSTWGRHDPRLAYLRTAYSEVYTDKTDLLFYFLKKAADICRGESAFIVSRSFLEGDKARKLRGWVAKNSKVRSVTDFRHALVFPKVGINTAIIQLTKSAAVKNTRFARFRHTGLRPGYTDAYLRDAKNFSTVEVPTKALGSEAWNFGDAEVQRILAKMDAAGTKVGEVLHIGQGMQTAANSAFEFEASHGRMEALRAEGLLYERARNSDIHAYYIGHSRVHMLYLEGAKSFGTLPADVRAHLEDRKAVLTQRAAFVRGNCEWWRYSWPLHKEYFGRARILSPYRSATNRFALDEEASFIGITDTTVLYDNGQPEDLRYILGLLNTRILTARFRFIGKLLGGGVLEYYENTVSRLPIVRSEPGEEVHDRIVNLVRRAEEAEAVLRTSLVGSELEAARAERQSCTDEIEHLVAGLFGLTEGERRVLEEYADARVA